MRRLDLFTGVTSAVVGVAAFVDANDLAVFGASGEPGPGFFPKILAGLLTFLGLLLAAMSFRDADPADAEPEDHAVGAGRTATARAVGVLVAFAVIAPLVELVGYVPAMILLVLVVLYGIERRRDFVSLVAALVIPVATYLLFAHAFAIPLPPGPLLPA